MWCIRRATRLYPFVAMLFLSASGHLFANVAELETDSLRVKIELDTTSEWFGAVVSYRQKNSSDTSASNRWFRLRSGERIAASRHILVHNADTVCVQLSQFGRMPLYAIIRYRVAGNAVIMECAVWSTESVQCDGGIALDMHSGLTDLSYQINGYKASSISLVGAPVTNVHCNTNLIFSNTRSKVHFVFRNPFHSLWEIGGAGAGKHVLWVLQTLKPRGKKLYSQLEGPDFAPVLAANDTLYRRVEIHGSGTVEVPVAFSENPNGLSHVITMYWDELKNHGKWPFMTTADAQDVVYDRYFVRLMNELPAVKMGYLLMLDRFLFRKLSAFDSWLPNSPNILADSLEEASGHWCVSMIAETTSTLAIRQRVTCTPGAYTLRYRVKTAGVTGTGAFAEVVGSSNHLLVRDVALSSSNGWQQRSLVFSAGIADSEMEICLCLQNATGVALFDDVSLMRDGTMTELLSNGGFELNNPFILYDNVRRHWSDAHGKEYLVAHAPQPYLDFLKRIENGTIVYGWEKRVRLGSHGYHHTPSLTMAEPDHEFQFYDPIGDSLRVHRIFSETHRLGLSNASLRFWRTAGHKYSSSLINRLIDSGVVFFDPGDLVYPGTDRRFACYILQRGHKRMCAPLCAFWADASIHQPPENLYGPLEKGHLGHIGAHPEDLFSGPTEESYQRFYRILADAEQRYPNLGYVFPDEYGDNAARVFDLRVVDTRADGNDMLLAFSGTVTAGVTVVLVGRCDGATFDGASVATKYDGLRTLVTLPAAADTLHRVVFTNAQAVSIRAGTTQLVPHPRYVFDANRGLVRVLLNRPGYVHLEIFDTRGRLVHEIPPTLVPSGPSVMAIPMGRTVPGVYCCRLFLDSQRYVFTWNVSATR